MIIQNKYNNFCVTCKIKCPAGTGWAVKENNSWFVYCDDHTPSKPVKKIPVYSSNIKRHITAEGEIYTGYEPENLPFLRAFPGAKWNGIKKCWEFSLDAGDRIRVLELALKLKLEIDPKLLDFKPSQQAEAAKVEGLYTYQVFGVDWLSKGKKRLLADEMGCGKTVTTICAIPKNARTIIIVPAGLRYNWVQELEKWRSEIQITVLKGEGIFKIPEKNEAVIISYDSLPKWLEPVAKDPNKKWDLIVEMDNNTRKLLSECILIADEVQKVKNYKTARAKRVKGLSMSCGRVWGLTGTPLYNRPPDLFGVLDNLNMQYEVFKGWNNFVKLMNGQRGGWGSYEWGEPDSSVPELIRKVMLRRLRSEVLPELPDKTYTFITVDLPKELQSDCDDLWEEWGDYIQAQFNEKKSDLPPFEEFAKIRAKLAESRISVLEDLVEEHEDSEIPLIVFSDHKLPVETIGKRKGWAFITGDTSPKRRQEIVNDFQDGKLRGVACTIKAGGTGLTLTKAWKAIFVDLNWVPAENEQAQDRLVRISQKSNKVEIVQLVSNHPLDLHIQKLINWKSNIARKALNSPEVIPCSEKIIANLKKNVKKVASKKKEKKELVISGRIPKDKDIPF